jgi:hypothetical protein
VRRRLTALAACLVLAAVPLAGCGDKAPGIPRRDASELIALLKMAREEADNPSQQCDELLATVQQIEAKVGDLPSSVDSDVRDSLSNGVRNLAASAGQECSQTQTTPTTPTTPTVTETTPTTPTETTPTTPTETTPTTPTTPPATTPPTTTPTPTTPGTGGASPGNGKKQKHEKAVRR